MKRYLVRGKCTAFQDRPRFNCVIAGVVGAVGAVGAISSASAAKSASKNAAASANRTADASERVANAELEFAKQQDADNKIRFAKADALTEKVTNKQLEAMDMNTALAKDYDEYNKSTFRPLEQSIVEDAKKYDSPEEQEKAAGAASASVKQNVAQASEATARAQARMGVNPNSGRALVTQSEAAITGALGEASAENTARQNVKTVGQAKRMDAASLGRNLASSQATSAGLGITAGTAAVNATATTNNSALSGAGTVGGLYSGAGSQFTSASNTYTKIADAATASGAAQAAAWGQLGGMGMGMLSKK